MKDLWTEENVTATAETPGRDANVYPNPTTDRKVYLSMNDSDVKSVRMMTYDGRSSPVAISGHAGKFLLEMGTTTKGLFILEVTTKTKIEYFKLSVE